jgi:Ca-activated chloride channel family protein
MSLYWPGSLLLLGLIPVTIALYVWSLRRPRPAVRYSSLSLLREALPRRSRLRRHVPFALFLLALASLITAFARPAASVSVPAGQATIILAIDVSRSMCSTDIPPNRLETAKAAAHSFISSQEPGTLMGIVAFGSSAQLLLPPTADRNALNRVVDSLTIGRRTAIGSGILESLQAIADADPSVAPPASGEPSTVSPPPPAPPGTYAPAIIVVLTDGASNQGPPPLVAAEQARDRGVRVYTIGFGTAHGGEMACAGLGGRGNLPYGPGAGTGGGFPRAIDEPTLQSIAEMTDGKYYSAESAGELEQVFHSLPTHLVTRHKTTEITVAFAALGALLVMGAIVLASLWHPLP